jgi:hypothetical protein
MAGAAHSRDHPDDPSDGRRMIKAAVCIARVARTGAMVTQS